MLPKECTNLLIHLYNLTLNKQYNGTTGTVGVYCALNHLYQL